jgi:hypothetical protein
LGEVEKMEIRLESGVPANSAVKRISVAWAFVAVLRFVFEGCLQLVFW